MPEKKRIGWIDVAKGICMLSVIAGHLKVDIVNRVVYPYALTIFFILMGYMLKNNLCKENLSKRFKSLMVPYFVTCVAVTIMDVFNSIVLDGEYDFMSVSKIVGYDIVRSFIASGTTENFGDVSLGGRIGAIWFFPAAFFAALMAQLLLKYVASRKTRYAMALSVAAMACILGSFIWLPFSIQSGMLTVPFILLGYDLKQEGQLEDLRTKGRSKVFLCFCVFVVGIILNESIVNYARATMNDYLVSMVCAVTSSFVIIYISQVLQNSKMLAWIGKNSQYCLCIHLFEMECMKPWFSMFLEFLGLPVNVGTRYVLKIIFILLVTWIILKLKSKLPRRKQIVATEGCGQDLTLNLAKAGILIMMLIGQFDANERFERIICGIPVMIYVFYSGYCFSAENAENLFSTLKREVKTLLLPYAAFGVVYVLLIHDGIWIELKRLFLGLSASENLFASVGAVGLASVVLMLFLTRVIYLVIDKILHDEMGKAICVLGLSMLGLLLGERGYWLPWSADCSLYALALFYLGHCFKKYRVMEYLCERNYFYFVLSSICAYMVYKGGLDVTYRSYGMYGLSIMGVVSAAVLVYMASGCLRNGLSKYSIQAFCQIGNSGTLVLTLNVLISACVGQLLSKYIESTSVYYVLVLVLLQLLLILLFDRVAFWMRRNLRAKRNESASII